MWYFASLPWVPEDLAPGTGSVQYTFHRHHFYQAPALVSEVAFFALAAAVSSPSILHLQTVKFHIQQHFRAKGGLS